MGTMTITYMMRAEEKEREIHRVIAEEIGSNWNTYREEKGIFR